MKEIGQTGSTKQRILNATLVTIAEEGYQNVTIRKIATRADVNVAAINYHFGSKDNVINEALRSVTAQMISAFIPLGDSEQAPKTRLEGFINAYSDAVFFYPDIIRNLIVQNLADSPARIAYQEYLEAEGILLIRKTLSELQPDDDMSVLNMRALQLISCLSFPVLLGERIKETAGVDIKDEQIRKKYAAVLLETYLR